MITKMALVWLEISISVFSCNMVFQDVFELREEITAFIRTVDCLCLVSFFMTFQVIHGRERFITLRTLESILSSIMHGYVSVELGPIQGVVITLLTLIYFSFPWYWDIV